MKGVGDIHDKKNIALPPHRFRTLTSNAYIALAKNDNTNDNDDNNLYTPVSVRKQKEDDNSFDNYITSKIGVDNRDALAKKVNNINNNNNSINTIDRSKEGVGTIDIVETPGTGNNSSNTIEPSKIGVGKKESNHNNTVIVDSKTKDDYIVSDPDSVSPCLDHIVVSDSVSRSDTRTSINDTSSNNLIHNTNLDLEKGSLPWHKISESTTIINDFIPLITITTINDFIPLSTVTKINNDNISTGTPYHTSNNYDNINDNDFGSQAKVEVDFRNEPGPLSKSLTINDKYFTYLSE